MEYRIIPQKMMLLLQEQSLAHEEQSSFAFSLVETGKKKYNVKEKNI